MKNPTKTIERNLWIPETIFLPEEATKELLHRLEDKTNPQEALEALIRKAEEQDEAREFKPTLAYWKSTKTTMKTTRKQNMN